LKKERWDFIGRFSGIIVKECFKDFQEGKVVFLVFFFSLPKIVNL
jgi:hypothetical protein